MRARRRGKGSGGQANEEQGEAGEREENKGKQLKRCAVGDGLGCRGTKGESENYTGRRMGNKLKI